MVNDIEIPTDLNNREPLYVHFNSYKKIGINQIFNICALLEKSKSLKRKKISQNSNGFEFHIHR